MRKTCCDIYNYVLWQVVYNILLLLTNKMGCVTHIVILKFYAYAVNAGFGYITAFKENSVRGAFENRLQREVDNM